MDAVDIQSATGRRGKIPARIKKMTEGSLSILENSLKVSQKRNRQSYAQVVERILALSEKQPFDYDPSDPLKNLRKDYLRLAHLLVQVQEGRGNGGSRAQVKDVAEFLVINGIKFHLNFFQPSLLGLVEKKAIARLIREMKRTFAAKNADYGNAFRFWGIPGLLVRIGDKFFRLTNLTRRSYNFDRREKLQGAKRRHKRKVEEEKVPDTALDLANYSIMLLMLLDEGRSLKWGE